MTIAIQNWNELDRDAQAQALMRPALADDAARRQQVERILAAVQSGGDAKLIEYSARFDGAKLERIRVGEGEFDTAERSLPKAAIAAIDTAVANVRTFHAAQMPEAIDVETVPGVRCQRLSHPLDSVGLYVPAGTAPLPSTAIMLCVPAALAGCPETVLCTPARADGSADPAVLVAARRAGVDTVCKVGGAHAIAALAYGTESVPKVAKIFGPGSAWVTTAKTLVANDPLGAAIDMPAGPSEVLVIADDSANAEFVAADLLSQAEHGVDSQVVLLSPDRDIAGETVAALERQLRKLGRAEIARQALAHARIIVTTNLAEAIDISNRYAPEHLILQIRAPRAALSKIRNAGSVFLGPWSPEAVGDYCSGTNHVLPTYGSARAYSGLSVSAFMRQMTVQELSRDGLEALSSTVTTLAELEGLDAHAAAVRYRLAG